jgi:hypothetical protein
MILLNGCASSAYVYNIKSESELKGNKKVLAGRFACFDNDAPVHCTKSGFFIFFNRDGEPQAKLLSPDDAGYVYIAVTEGYYNFGTIVKEIKDGRGLRIDLDPFPQVLVQLQDSLVNFGTLEVRFYQNPGSKGSTSQSGEERAEIRINHVTNYDVTRSEIASRVGKIKGSMSNGTVRSLPRAHK